MNRLTLDSERFSELRGEARKQLGDGKPLLNDRAGNDARYHAISNLQRDLYGAAADDNATTAIEALTRLQDAGAVTFPTSAENMIMTARFEHADAAFAFGVAMGAEWVLLTLGIRIGGAR